jgi:MFS family permease
MTSGPELERQPTSRQAGLRFYLSGLGGFSRNAKLFLTVTAFRGMVIASLQTVLNLYLYSLGYDPRFIGLISGANALAILAMSLPAGYLADRVGRRPVLVVGGLAYPLAITGLSVATSTPLIILFNILFGICGVAYWVAGVPLLYASTDERQRVQAFSVNSFLLWGLGPLGAFLSGQAVEIAAPLLHVSSSSSAALRVGMLFMAGLAFAGAVPYIFMREERRVITSEPAPPARLVVRLFAQLLVPDLVLAFGYGSVVTFVQLYFHLRFGLSPGPVGVIVGIGGTMAGAATLLTPLLVRRWGTLRTTARCNWLVTPMIMAMAFAMQLTLAIPAYWLAVAFRGMNDPAYTAFVQERVPEAYRGRATGLYSVTYSIGAALGPAFSGQIQKIGGFTPAFLMGGLCYGVGASLLFLFFRGNAGRRLEAAGSQPG